MIWMKVGLLDFVFGRNRCGTTNMLDEFNMVMALIIYLSFIFLMKSYCVSVRPMGRAQQCWDWWHGRRALRGTLIGQLQTNPQCQFAGTD